MGDVVSGRGTADALWFARRVDRNGKRQTSRDHGRSHGRTTSSSCYRAMRSVANIQVVILVSGGVELCYIVLGPVVGSNDESTGQVFSDKFAQQFVLFISRWSVAKL
jgi:hypothetical protein